MEATDNYRDNNAHGEGRNARLPIDAPSVNLQKYRDLLGEVELPPEQVDEFLTTLNGLMSAWVQYGFDAKIIPAFFPEIFDDASDPDEGAVDSGEEDTNE